MRDLLEQSRDRAIRAGGWTVLLAIGAAMPLAAVAQGASPDAPSLAALPHGDVWTNPQDGQSMIRVPAGEFALGADDEDKDSRPAQKVRLAAYYIGKTEVTVGQFRRFVGESGCDLGTRWQEHAQNDNWPVAGVTWTDARAYCDWASLRLATEAEWEKAARGTDGRKWPWGTEWVAGRANVAGAEDGYAQIAPVGSFPAGSSPYGCLDMAGNVWEWTASLFRPYPYDPHDGRENYAAPGSRIVRGGGWTEGPDRARATSRLEAHADGFGANMGFRRAASAPALITVRLAGASVRTAIAQVCDAAGREYRLDETVQGTVTFRAADSPFETALNTLLAMASLSYRLDEGVYRITGLPAGTAARKPDYAAMAAAAVDGLLPHFWLGDEATGHILPTYGGYGNPKPPDQRGILWEDATFLCVLENLYQVTKSARLRRRIAAEWAYLQDRFLPRELQSCGGGSQNPCCDDASWTTVMYLRIYRATRDPAALECAKALVLNAFQRWADGQLGGLWYRDQRDARSSVHAALILAALWIHELTKERVYWDRAMALYEWTEQRLLRSDGLYWWWYWRHGPERYAEPRGEGVSDTFLGANMAMAIVHARLFRATGLLLYQDRALRTADAVVAGETNGSGALLNDRDAWADGYFMGEWVRDVTTLPGARREYGEIVRRTAQAVWEHARAPKGFLSACWASHDAGGCPWSSPQIPIRSSKSHAEQIMTSASSANVIIAAAALRGY